MRGFRLWVWGLCLLLVAPMAQGQRTSQHAVYDSHDRLAVLITYEYDSVGTVSTRQLQSFDRDGRLLRTELYTADERLLFVESLRYDRHGNRTHCRQTDYDEEGLPHSTHYRYRYRSGADGSWRLRSIVRDGQVLYTTD